MAIGDYKLKYQIDGDSKGLKAELKEVDGLFGKLSGGLTSSLGPASAVLGGIATGVAAIGTAAVITGTALFNLTRSAAEYGSQLFDFQQKTGLAAETISALDIAAKQSGSSLENISSSTAKFSKLLGSAADGNEQSRKTLEELGVTSTDLDEALNQVFKTIADAEPGVQQMTLSQKAFGKSGADMIPVVNQMNGSLKNFTEEAKKLGLTLTDADIKAADEFGDTLDQLSGQVKVAAATFALQFAPVLTEGMQMISIAFVQNQDVVRTWGETTGRTIRNVAYAFEFTNGYIDQFNEKASTIAPALREVGAGVDTTLIIPMDRAADAIDRVTKALIKLKLLTPATEGSGASKSQEGGGFALPSIGDFDSLTGGKVGGASGDAAARQRARESLANAEMSARIQLENIHLDNVEKAYSDTLGKLREEFQKTGDKARFLEESTAALASRNSAIQEISDLLNSLEFQQLGIYSGPQADALEAKQRQRVDRLNDTMKKNVDENFRLIEAGNTKVTEALKKGEELVAEYRNKMLEEAIDLNWKRIEQEEELLRLMQASSEWRTSVMDGKAPTGTSKEINKSGIGQVGDILTNIMGEDDAEAFRGLSDIVTSSFDQMGQAAGSALEAFILFGSAGGSFDKFAAQMIASIAKMAVIQAIWNTAEGLAKLALAYFGHPTAGPSATAHFAAAAMYAGIAGVATGLGRAVAGDNFKQGSANGYDAEAGLGSSSGRTRAEDLRPYSRASDDAYMSGSRRREDTEMLDAIRSFAKIVRTAKPGEVFVAGMKANPGAVGRQNVADIKRNSSIGSAMGRAIGLK